jgi:hypothetical protein
MRTATLLVAGLSAASALSIKDIKAKAHKNNKTAKSVAGRAIDAPIAPREVLNTKKEGRAVALLTFSEADCKGIVTGSTAYLSGHVLYDYGSYYYFECRSDGIFYAESDDKAFDPTAESGYDKVTFEFDSGKNTECSALWNSLWTCGYDGDIDPKNFIGETYYVADKCSKGDNLGQASYTNVGECMKGGPTGSYIYGCHNEDVQCFSDDACATSADCPTDDETDPPYDAAKSCYEEAYYDSDDGLGCFAYTSNVLYDDLKCNSYAGAFFNSKCGQYMPGAPNLNGAAAVAPAVMVVASAVATAFLF